MAVADAAKDAAPGVGAAAKDAMRGAFEAPVQIVGGVLDAINAVADGLEKAIPLGGITVDDSGISLVSSDELAEARAAGSVTDPLNIEKGRTNTGAFIRASSQFLTGFLPLFKVARAAGGGVIVSVQRPAPWRMRRCSRAWKPIWPICGSRSGSPKTNLPISWPRMPRMASS